MRITLAAVAMLAVACAGGPDGPPAREIEVGVMYEEGAALYDVVHSSRCGTRTGRARHARVLHLQQHGGTAGDRDAHARR